MKRWVGVLSLLTSLVSMSAAWADKSDLVLVSSSTSSIPPLKADVIRKLYLGIPAFVDGHPIKPLLNHSSRYLQEVFMQKIMFMSTPAFERQILSRVFRMGGNRPPVYTELNELLSALKADSYAITYLESNDARTHPEIKIIATLWKMPD